MWEGENSKNQKQEVEYQSPVQRTGTEDSTGNGARVRSQTDYGVNECRSGTLKTCRQ